MTTIWKYPFEVTSRPQHYLLPTGAKIVHVEMQNDDLCAWILVNPTQLEPHELHHFVVHGTGHTVFDNEHYIGTAQAPPYMWHLFEVI